MGRTLWKKRELRYGHFWAKIVILSLIDLSLCALIWHFLPITVIFWCNFEFFMKLNSRDRELSKEHDIVWNCTKIKLVNCPASKSNILYTLYSNTD